MSGFTPKWAAGVHTALSFMIGGAGEWHQQLPFFQALHTGNTLFAIPGSLEISTVDLKELRVPMPGLKGQHPSSVPALEDCSGLTRPAQSKPLYFPGL